MHLITGYYSAGEGDGSIEICAQVTTDRFDHTIQFDYLTIAGSATGEKFISNINNYRVEGTTSALTSPLVFNVHVELLLQEVCLEKVVNRIYGVVFYMLITKDNTMEP